MRRLATVLIWVAGLFAAFMAFAHFQSVERARELMRTGAQAQGTVTEQLGTRGSNAKFYSYTFRAGTREWKATRRDIPWAAREIPVGAKLAVRYDPAKPERSITPAELEEAESWANRMLFPLVAAALLGWGVARIARRKKPPI